MVVKLVNMKKTPTAPFTVLCLYARLVVYKYCVLERTRLYKCLWSYYKCQLERCMLNERLVFVTVYLQSRKQDCWLKWNAESSWWRTVNFYKWFTTRTWPMSRLQRLTDAFVCVLSRSRTKNCYMLTLGLESIRQYCVINRKNLDRYDIVNNQPQTISCNRQRLRRTWSVCSLSAEAELTASIPSPATTTVRVTARVGGSVWPVTDAAPFSWRVSGYALIYWVKDD